MTNATVINRGYTEEADIVLGAFAVVPALHQVKTADKEIQMDGVAGRMEFCDPAAPSRSQRFYRARSTP